MEKAVELDARGSGVAGTPGSSAPARRTRCVKMTFAKGAALEDPSGLFNSSLEGNTRRAIDFREGDKIDEKALKALVRAAVALNTSVRATAHPVRSQKRPKSAGIPASAPFRARMRRRHRGAVN